MYTGNVIKKQLVLEGDMGWNPISTSDWLTEHLHKSS